MRLGWWFALALACLALTGCETTAEKSAQLERHAKRVTLTDKGLAITQPSTDVKVLGTAVVRDAERAAVVVTLENRSAHAQRDVPIAITVKSARGRTVFQNNGAGLEGALVSVPSIPGHGTVSWVDDQVPVTGAPATASAKVGEAASVAGPLPELVVGGTRVSEDPASGLIATGQVRNHSNVAQSGLVVFVVGRRAGKVVAAGRAIVTELAPSSSAPFQVSLVGDARGAQVQSAAPAASFG